ncbi:hypothetical protein GJ496_000218 [Pomphorhynchus laevis]|nr:hypothetical protein GJ496_000218 [Pomphorhynchus laevis]
MFIWKLLNRCCSEKRKTGIACYDNIPDYSDSTEYHNLAPTQDLVQWLPVKSPSEVASISNNTSHPTKSVSRLFECDIASQEDGYILPPQISGDSISAVSLYSSCNHRNDKNSNNANIKTTGPIDNHNEFVNFPRYSWGGDYKLFIIKPKRQSTNSLDTLGLHSSGDARFNFNTDSNHLFWKHLCKFIPTRFQRQPIFKEGWKLQVCYLRIAYGLKCTCSRQSLKSILSEDIENELKSLQIEIDRSSDKLSRMRLCIENVH